MTRLVFILTATLSLAACASPPGPEPEQSMKALFVGHVESAKYLTTLQDIMPNEGETLWHGEVYEVKLKVTDRLSGGPVSSSVTLKVTAHARRFVGMTLAVMTDPNMTFYGVNLGTSWWEDVSPEAPMLCVPDDLLRDEAYATFIARSVAADDSHCLEIR